jgi:hypothetical protein
MSSLPIPGAHPWITTTITNQRDTVRMTVGTGHKTREHDLHVDALRERSSHFRNTLPSFTTKPKHRPSVHLALAIPQLLSIFAH